MNKKTKNKLTIDAEVGEFVENELFNLETSLANKLIKTLEEHTEGTNHELKDAIYDVLFYEININFPGKLEKWALKVQETKGTGKGGAINTPNQSQTDPKSQINKTANN